MERDEETLKKVSFTPFKFMSHTTRYGGVLPDAMGAHACWYYCRCAWGMLCSIRDGAEYEGEDDHINMLNNLARSVAMIYRLDSPSDFTKYMGLVNLEAIRCNIPWDDRMANPSIFTFIAQKRGH